MRKNKILFLLLIGVLLSFSKAEAQITLGTEFRANTTTANDQQNPTVGVSSSGHSIIAWESMGSSANQYDIRAQRYDPTGAVLGTEFVINTTTTTEAQRYPDVAMNSSGMVNIVWQSMNQDGSSNGIYYKRLSVVNGTVYTAEQLINTTTTGNQMRPKVAVNSAGNGIIVWMSEGQDGDSYGIYGRRFNNSGAVGSEFLINNITTGYQGYPDVAMENGGAFTVAWQSNGTDGSGNGIYARRYNAAGTALGNQFLVNSTTAGNQQEPSIAVTASGEFAIVWSSYNQDGSEYGVYAQIYNASGTVTTPEFLVNTSTNGNQSHADIVASPFPNNRFFISWTNDAIDNDKGGVFITALETNGTQTGIAQVNNRIPDYQQFSAVGSRNDTTVIVAFQDGLRHNTATHDGDEYGVYANRVNIEMSCTGPMAGTYTIDNTQTTSGTVFASFGDAVQAMIDCGISAPVIFNVTASQTFTEQIEIPTITGSSSTNTVTFNGNGSTLQFSATNSNIPYTLRLNGADYFRFNNLTIEGLNTTIAHAVRLFNAADNNIFDSCIINVPLNAMGNTACMYIANDSINYSTSLNNSPGCDSNIIQNCEFNSGNVNIWLSSRGTDSARGNQILNCSFYDGHYCGLNISYGTPGTIVANNKFAHKNRTSFTGGQHFDILYYITTDHQCYNNHFTSELSASPSTGHPYTGIRLYGSANTNVINNLIEGIDNGGGTLHGISDGYNSNDNVNIWHNTIHLNNPGAQTYGIQFTSPGSNRSIQNNNISLDLASGTGYGLYLVNGVASNYNNIYLTGTATNYVGRFGTTDYISLANWQGANGGVWDQNSTSLDPQFVNPAIGNFSIGNASIYNSGTSLGVLDDINGAPRSTTAPTVGAFENTCTGPLAGNYTIDNTTATAGTNYNSFDDAVQAMIDCGISAPVTFDVASGQTFTERIDIPEIVGASSTNTITFNGNSATITYSSSASTDYQTIRMNGADYFRFNDLNIVSNGASYNATLHMYNSADNNIFDNCTFTSVANSTSGNNQNIIIAGNPDGVFSANGTTTASDNTWQNCTINNGRTGIYCSANNPVSGSADNAILNCDFLDQKFNGIYLLNSLNTEIDQCDFSRPSRTDLTLYTAIDISNGAHSTKVSKNYIHDLMVSSPATITSLRGISVGASPSSSSLFNLIENNLFEGFEGGPNTGIFIYSTASGVQIYHNTIAFHSALASSSATNGIYNQNGSAAGIDIRNNNVSITRNTSGNKYGLNNIPSTATCDYNNVYVNTTYANDYYGRSSSVNLLTLANWQANTAHGTNSTNVDPQFVNPAIGDFSIGNTTIGSSGAALGVVDDIKGITRSTTAPTVGAFETTCTAPLAGTYTIDNTQITSGTNYQSFGDAVQALIDCGINAPVIFDIASGQTFTEQINIPEISGASFVNTVTINGNGSTLTHNAGTSNSIHTLLLFGADHFRINNLNVNALGTNGAAILLADNANHNIIDSCTTTLLMNTNSSANRQYGILLSSDTSMTSPWGTDIFDGCDSNIISNNTTIGGYRGILIRGNSSTRSTNNTIINNVVTDFGFAGIYFHYTDNSLLANNEILRVNRTVIYGTTEPVTVYISDQNIIEKNHIHSLFPGALASGNHSCRGYLIGLNSLTASPTRVQNNLIENIHSLGIHEGIELLGTHNVELYHNTIVLDDNTTGIGNTYGIWVRNPGTASMLDVKNNNIVIDRNTSANNYGINLNNNTNAVSDYNNVYITNSGGTNSYGFLNTPYTTLVNWQTGSSQDANSTDLNPQFVNPATDDYSISNSAIFNSGTPVGVLDDINGIIRFTAAPTVGAFESVCSSPLAGTYTINNLNPTAGTSYNSFSDAVADLISCGISAPVIFDVAIGQTFTEQIEIPLISGVSATNTITFNGNGSTLTNGTTTNNDQHTLRLNQAAYVTVDSLNIMCTNATYAFAIQMLDSAHHIQIVNCDISVPANTTVGNHRPVIINNLTSGINATNSVPSCSYITIENCNISNGYHGIDFYGTSNTLRGTSNRIIDCNIYDYYSRGIYSSYQDSILIQGNDLSRPTRTVYFSSHFGIDFYHTYSSKIDANKIHDWFAANPNSSNQGYGITLSTSATLSTKNIISNNLIYDVSSRGHQTGIYLVSGARYADIFHNTIVLDDLLSTNSRNTHGIRATSSFSGITGIDVRNNNIYITRPGNNIRVGLYYFVGVITSDYNNVYVNGVGGSSSYARRNSINYNTLASWQASNSNAFDQNSTDLAPQFVNPAAADYTIGNATIFASGTALGVLDDINGATRSTINPTVGAFESGCSPMAGTYTINPANPATVGNFQTIDSAVQRMILCGINAPVVFSIAAANTFNEQILIPEISGASATNTVTFNGNGSTLTHAATSIGGAYTMRLDGADYFRFDSLIFECTGSNYGFGAHLIDDANHNIFDKCEFNLPANSNGSWQAGIVMSCTYAGGLATGTLGASDSNQVINCIMNNGKYGVFAFAHPADIGVDNLIENNRAYNHGENAYRFTRQTGLIIRGNEGARPTYTGTGSLYYGYLLVDVVNTLVDKNIVHTPSGGNVNSTGQNRGFQISGSPVLGQENIISNNIIANFRSLGWQVGISHSSINTKVLHNTIVFDDPAYSTQVTAGVIGSAPANGGVEYLNNLIHISRNVCSNGSGGSLKYGFDFTNAPDSCNYNNVYISGGGTRIHASIGTPSYNTLSDFQAALGGTFAQNSSNYKTAFVDQNNFDFTPTNTALYNTGGNVNIADDYNGTARSTTTPDIGALESGNCTPLAGTYTINPSLAASATNFQSFTAASNALNCGISAPVVFNVVASTAFTEQVDLYEIAGASATNTITFNGNNSTLTFDACQYFDPHTLRLNGSDFITINNLNIENTGTFYAEALRLWDGANSNTFDNCTISVPLNVSGSQQNPIIIGNASYNIIGPATGTTCDNNSITNSTIRGGRIGIRIFGLAADIAQGNIVDSCIIEDFTSTGIWTGDVNNTLLRSNNFSRPTLTSFSSFTGIRVDGGSTNSLVNKNHIHNPFVTNPASTLSTYGIRVDAIATVGNENVLSNNLLEDFESRGALFGIYLNSGARYINVFHNTVVFDDLSATTNSAYASGLYSNSSVSQGINYSNNNIYITRQTTGQNTGMYLRNPSNVCDHNNVFVNGASATNYYGYHTSSVASLTNWQAVNGGAWGQNSRDADPIFVNPSINDYTPTNPVMNNLGTSLGVLDDINGLTRNVTTPDAGAFEWSCSPINGTYTIDPVSPIAPSNVQTFQQAVDLLSCGINGPVVFNVVGVPTFTEQIDIPQITGSSSTNTVTFNGNGSTLTFSGTNSSIVPRHTLMLSGADYFRFNNLNITNTASVGQWGTAVHLHNASDNNIFDTCTIVVSKAITGNNLYPFRNIYNNGLNNTLTAASSSNAILNSIIEGGRYGIELDGHNTDSIDGFQLINSTVRDAQNYILDVYRSNNIIIRGNDISNPTNASSFGSGLNFVNGCNNVLVEKNYIHNLRQAIPNSTQPLYGIRVHDQGVLSQPIRLRNNVLSHFESTNAQYGIYISSNVDSSEIEHNTIDMSGGTTYTGSTTSTIYQAVGINVVSTSSSAHQKILNNNINITRTGNTAKKGIALNNTTSVCDYNNIYVNGPGLHNYTVNSYTNLAQWQLFAGGIYGQNSYSVDPQFVNPAINDYNPSNLSMDNIGTSLGVTDDIENVARSVTSPDVGAYEFACSGGSTIVTNFVSPTDTTVSCFGAMDAQISVQSSLGVAPYTYYLVPGTANNTTGSFTNLDTGSYIIVVYDASSCTDTITFNVTQPDSLVIDSIVAVNPNCTPSNNGSLTVYASGGTTSYNYDIGATGQVSSSFTGLTANTYTITVTDANNCTATTLVTLSIPPVPTITSTLDTNVSCNGAGDGSIAVIGTGATAITYTLNPGAASNSTGYFNNLTPNTYTVTLSDASNCTVATTVVITQPTVMDITSVTPTNPTCIPGNDGSLVVNATGGTLGYQYNIGGANQGSNTFTSLTANTYLVTVTDTNSCTDTMSVTLITPPVPTITSTLDTNVSCNGAGDGSIAVTGTGATAITYTLNPGAVSNSTGYFNNLSPNTYTVTLSDASNCTVATSVTITEPLVLDITSVTPTNPSCSPGSDGSLVVNATGGTLGYQYNIGGANQGSNTFTSLTANTYLVTVTDTNSCNDTISVTLVTPPVPTITSTLDTNVSCNGAGDGSIAVTGTGASAITYTLNPGAVSNSTGYFGGLGPNIYTVTLSDASNCTVATAVTIIEPIVLNIDSLTATNPTCTPGGDGSIVVNISGGTAGFLYDIGAASQVSNTFSNLGSATYIVTVTDTNSCTDTMSVTLTAPGAPTIVSSADTNVSCNGAADGSILFTASGIGAISYNLQPTNITNATGYFGNLGPNSYSVTATDASGCTVSTTVNITQPAILNIDSLTSTLPSCAPGNDGSIIVHAAGGTTPYQYNVGGPNQTSNIFNNLASGIYLVTVTDTNACTDTMSIDLSAPNASVIASTLDTNVSCNGLANGSVQITGTAATSITYTLNPGAVSNATGYFGNLAPNTYTITLSDASSCTVSTSVTITEPAVLNIDSLTSTLPSCAPGNDGSIIVHAIGGTTPYQYNAGGPNQASNTFNNLASGIYLVTVTDTNSCTDTMSIDLSAPSAPVITGTLDTNVSCNGLANGSVQVSGTAATTITYTLNPGAVSNATGYFGNLAPNTYTITLSDASSCTVSTSVTITEPAQLNIDSLTSTLPSCTPGNDGSIIVNATGGTMLYQYNVGGVNQSSNTFNNLASGIYLVTVTDTNSCTDTMSVDLSAPNAPVITSIIDTNVSCFGSGDGSIQVTGTGASAITYTLNPGAIANSTGYFNNLVPNTYSITLSDASNCTVSTSVTISQSANALNIDSLSSTLPSCAPGNDGSIIVNATGGTMPYQYNVGGTNQSSNSFTNLASGIYLVKVTDTNACTDTMSIDLSAPNAPVITSIIDTNVSCYGLANGSVQVTGTASTSITYTLNPGAVSNATGYFGNLAPNTYTITLSDASSCTVSTSVTITEPAQLNIDSLTSTLPSCAPGNDGSIIVHAAGGTTPYQYNVGGANQSNNTFNNLASGIYLVTVTDTNSCTDTISIDLSAPNAPVITSTLDTNVSCNGANDGSIAISGAASTAITYTLNPGAVSNATGYFGNLAPNTYTITLSDASSCTVSTSVTITEPAQLNIDSLTSTLPSCAPGNDGSIIVHAIGGTTPYQYNVGGANQSSNTFNNLASGIYLVTVTDTNACTDTMSVDLTSPIGPSIVSVADTNVDCNNANNGSIQITATGTGVLTYTLNPGAVSNSNGYFNSLAPNTYTISVSDPNSCSVTTTVTISQPTALNIDSLTSVNPSCSPGGDGSIVVNVTGGTTPYQYNIGGSSQASNAFSNLSSATYLVTVTDTNNCVDTMSVNLSAPNAPTITSTLDTNISCNGLANGSVQVTGTGASAITYTLNPGALSNATGYFNNLGPNTYTITLSDASNCTISTAVVITEPASLTIDSLTTIDPSCSPGGDGSIVVNVTGGTTPYQYNNGGANQAINSFANLVVNTYLVTVIDSNNCTDTMSVNLVAPNVPVISSIVDTSVSCFGANDASIQIVGTANTSLTYTLNPGAVSNASGYFNSLTPNTYTITLSDVSNCTVSTTVNITQPNQLLIDSLTATSPSCSPGGDGSLVVNVSGGTSSFQYNIGGANQSSNSFSNLSAATYLVTVTDTNACTDTMSITLAPPTAPTITSTLDTNVSCNGLGNGSTQVLGTGASTITYTLNPGAVSNATGYFNNLVPNSYTIILSDASNCTVSTSVTITQPTALSLDSLTSSNPTCSPGGDGSIVVNVTGGTTPYQFNIGGANQASSSFANLAANTYLVTVIDSNNCTDTMSVNLLAPSIPVITSVVDTNVSCFGANDASIQILGTASTALTYTLNPGAVSNASGYFNNLAPNTYTISLSDASNCTVSTTVNITQPNQLLIDSLTATSPSCSPGGDGSLVVSISGGTPNFQYNIGGANQSSNSFTNLSAATYLVTVTDTNSCTNTMSITLAPPAAPSITSTLDTNVSCNGLGNGSVQVAGTGASAITYTLNPGAVSNATAYFNNLAPNTYTITLSDASNCTASTSVTITEPTLLSLDSLTTTNPTCSPGSDASIIVNATGGTTPYQYNIGGGNQASNSFANLAANTYLVTVIDSNNCTDTMSVILVPPAPPVVTSVTDTNVTCNGQNDGSIQVAGTGSSVLSYTLNPGAFTNTTAYFNNLGPNTYTITLSDASNCTSSTSVTITAPPSLNIDSITSSVPSCSPGGDGNLIVFANGGTTPYLYNIGGANQSSNTFNSLVSNTYLVTVTDSNSCVDTMTVDLNTPAGPMITSTVDTNVSCNGLANGSVQVSGTASSAITYTLNPGAVSNATGYFNNLTPNAYSITLSDANNCTASTTISITEPAALTWNPDTVSNISCNGLTDGSINITASGGTTPLAYTLNPGAITNATGAFINLGVNTYTIVASDANACSISTTIAITEPTALVLDSLSLTHETCSPGTDGAIVIYASGGTIVYTYDIGGASQTSNTFANLVGGTYTVTVADANNCTVSSIANITSATSPTIDSVSVTEASCNPGCDATAIINITQGTSSAITFSINGSAYQNANNFGSLCANNYTAYIQDANGCADTLAFIINTAATPVIDSMILTSTLCFGDSNATATVLASGGNGQLTYSLTPTSQSNTTGNFSGLYATNYMVSVVDTNGCQVDSNFTILDAPSLVWDSITVTDALCFGDSNGTITVTTNGGTGTITFGITPNPSSNTSGTFVGLGGNSTYTIVATDANACSISTTVFIAEPTAVGDSNIQVTNVTCNGAGDGSFSIQGTGGTPAYSYNLMPGNLNNATGSFTNLSGNTYTVTITDANNCTHTTTVTVVEPTSVFIDSTSITDVSCFGLSDGEIFVSAAGGVGNFGYNLQPGNISNVTGIYNGLAANSYTVTATDGNGCSVSTSLVVNEPLPIAIDSLDITNVSCNGLSDGAITVFSSGGNGGNVFLLNPGNLSNSSGVFNGLAANTYTMTVTDSKGCSVSIVDSVTEPLPLAATYTTDSVSCFGGSDGQIQVTTTGGTQPYTLTITPGATTNNTGLFTGLSAGSYTVNIIDSNGCPFTLNGIEIQQPTQVLFTSVNTVDVTCFGDSTGEISVTAAGGTGVITFAITPNIGTQSPSGNFTGLVATTYTVTATDANNCSTTTSVIINQNPEIRVTSYNYTEPICHGDSNGSLSFTAIGGVGVLQYSFEGSPYNSDTSHYNLPAGAYSLSIKDALGCQVDTSLILTEPDPVGVGSYTLTPTTCEDSEDGKIVLQATGGRPYYTYYRRPGISFNRNGIFPELKKGAYSITIKDSSGCEFDTTFNVLPNPNMMQTSITKTDLPCKGYGNEGMARVDVQGGIPPYTYLWSSTPASIEPEVSGLRFGFYFVEIIDGAGCKAIDTTYINPGDCCTEIFLPDAFSPNGDGRNDEFRVIGTAGIELRQFEIFNRWGQRVWQTANYTDSWNGLYRGEEQPIADYYFVFRYKCLTDGKDYIRKGNVTLIR